MTKPLPSWAQKMGVPVDMNTAAARLGVSRNIIYRLVQANPALCERRFRKYVFYPEHMAAIRAEIEARAKNEPTALYRHFAADGTLLYVGISRTVAARLAAHATSGWDRQIARIEVEWFDDRASAETAEREAIRAEKPFHNTIYNGGQA